MSTTTITTSKPSQTTPTSTVPKRLSASCQQVIHESITPPTKAHLIIRSFLSQPQLWPSITQHICHGVALTPSGLYADMAQVVAAYIWRANRGANAILPGIKVCNMDVVKTYIIDVPQIAGEEQWLEMEAVMDVSEYMAQDIFNANIRCTWRSLQPDGTKLNDLAYCDVQYEFDPGWLVSWSDQAPAIRTQISNLHTRARTERSGDVMHMYRDRAYELFKTFVDYGPKYQNMAEVVVDTKTLEATATLSFQPDPETDYTGPYYLDGSCHLSGFVCNAIEDTEKNAYISHGIGAMKLSPKFDPSVEGAVIQNYVRMVPLPKDATVMCGDVYVVQDGEIVGVWEGVKFKRIPKKVLNVFLPKPKPREA